MQPKKIILNKEFRDENEGKSKKDKDNTVGAGGSGPSVPINCVVFN
jgi:hypothetical protein